MDVAPAELLNESLSEWENSLKIDDLRAPRGRLSKESSDVTLSSLACR